MGVASVPGALWLRETIGPELGVALLLFALGAAAAGVLTVFAVLRFGRSLRSSARLALAIILLGTLTAGFDSFFLYLHYVTYYVQWWPEIFSAHWFFTAISTFLGVAFYFTSIGAPMLIPFGLPTMLAFAWALSRR